MYSCTYSCHTPTARADGTDTGKKGASNLPAEKARVPSAYVHPSVLLPSLSLPHPYSVPGTAISALKSVHVCVWVVSVPLPVSMQGW
ncbi:hypothetical protein IF2G_05294 [Cordyceps javanica]|nr:hypothetical protein IF2G_05294 [Cordyceps javanica]